jgi:hypothetical protein
MLVVEGARANLVGTADVSPRSFWLADAAHLVAELELAFACGDFSRLVVIAPSPALENLTGAMSPGLRAAVSKQRVVSAELALMPDEIEERFRRLRHALPFVA